MERREDVDWERPGRCREQQPAGLAVLPGSGRHPHTDRGSVLQREVLGFWGSAYSSWARGSPLSPPAMRAVLQQDIKSPLSDSKNVPVAKMNILI